MNAETKIVVLDRGFVFVGKVADDGDNIRVTNCRNVRRWGTTKGLGELRNGPTEDTVLDEVGEIIAPKRAVIYQIVCTKDW